jgi:hypothetical protein
MPTAGPWISRSKTRNKIGGFVHVLAVCKLFHLDGLLRSYQNALITVGLSHKLESETSMQLSDAPALKPNGQSLDHPTQLEKRLRAYAAAATAAGACVLTVAQPAEAKVVVTKTDKTISWNGKTTTKIDLNNDGVPDFGFGSDFQFCCSTRLLLAPFKFNQIMGAYWASALASGVTVGKSGNFMGQKAVMEVAFGNSVSTAYIGPWTDAKDKYLGLAFHINGQVHFGWARLTFTGFGAATLTEYAYETIPGKAIVTGDNGASEASAEKPAAVNPRVGPALGALALGADGLSLWRK